MAALTPPTVATEPGDPPGLSALGGGSPSDPLRVGFALTGRRLGLRYTPASARFGGRPVEVATPLPDVATLPEPVRRLHAVAAAAARELRPPVSP